MFRFLFRQSVGVCERSVLLAKRHTAAAASVSRPAHVGGVRAFSGSSSVRLCEKKSADPDAPTESPAVVTQTAAGDGQDDVINVAKQSEEPAALKTEEAGSPTQQQTDVEQVAAKDGGEMKSGKESLLDLLGAMKVVVTNKRKEDRGRKGFLQEEDSDTLDPELVAAASAAASTLPNQSQAESELLRQLREHEAIQFDDDGRGYTKRERPVETDESHKKSLFTGRRLNIFSHTTEGQVESAARPTLWDVEFAYQVSQAANQMPRNGLEEMIQWTKEGKMWEYPINNEAGLEEEADVPFHEHIFLDKHLEEGFPRQGPVRHFMELVVAGLSRNPYLTVQQKKEHISWFRDYFHQKEEVLKEAEV
ncbi:28S ribosomal protein S31 [Nibea albiflora]|uniref:28S ribosomal protein S31 n=1 Tax=Nibea albiflora TaxID=240163 RepID=A0ACB7F0X8_NIBAL|nr:28S ribosomal protein S31 [Nibea albiflora]